MLPFEGGAIGTEQLAPKINSVGVKMGGLQMSCWVCQGEDICVFMLKQDLDGVHALTCSSGEAFPPAAGSHDILSYHMERVP